MGKNEQVLVVPRSVIPDGVLNASKVHRITDGEVKRMCDIYHDYIDRDKAENDPAFKQVIPYIVIMDKDRQHVAIYNRNGTEGRLHGKWSLGVGGHINPMPEARHDFEISLLLNMKRELDEEFKSRPQDDEIYFWGTINYDTDDVGQVHLGVVYWIQTEHPELYIPGEELHCFQWIQKAHLKPEEFEIWSQMVIESTVPGKAYRQSVF